MKNNNKLVVILLISLIVLITVLSFFGVYSFKKVYGDNLVKDYTVGMNLKGRRVVRLKVDDTVNTVNYDSEGNKVEDKDKKEGVNYTVKEEPVNDPELLTKENYKKAKEIIEKRLDLMNADEYILRFNEETGEVELELIDDSLTDYILSAISVKGNFVIQDSETKEVLIDKSDVKNVRVGYVTTDSNSAITRIDVEFNKDGKNKADKLKENYVEKNETVVNENGESEEKSVGKKITVKIGDSDENGITNYVDQLILNGHLYISVGQETNDNSHLSRSGLQASIDAAIIGTDTVPFKYSVVQNNFILTNLNKSMIPMILLILLVLEAIVFIVVFKVKGIISAVLQIGYISLLTLVLRYTNVMITIEGIFAILIASIINMTFMFKILSSMNKGDNTLKTFKDNLVDFIKVNVPILIVAIVFCFVNWIEISSFGMIMFWSYVVSLIYNIVFTKGILKNI